MEKEREIMVRPYGTKSARVIQVIETIEKRGLGTEKDPVRNVTQYWDLDGKFLAEMDVEHRTPLTLRDCEAIADSTTLENFMHCPNCNRLILKSDKYCQFCGKSTETKIS